MKATEVVGHQFWSKDVCGDPICPACNTELHDVLTREGAEERPIWGDEKWSSGCYCACCEKEIIVPSWKRN